MRTPRIDMHRCSHSTTTIDALDLQVGHQRVGDLRGQPFLHLGATGEEVDQAGDLRQAGDPAVLRRDVADVGDAVERHEVVLAGAVDLDVAHDDHLVVVDGEGRLQHALGRRVEAREGLGVGAGDPVRGVAEPLTVGVLTDGDEQLPHRRRGAVVVDRHRGQWSLQCSSVGSTRPPSGTSITWVRGSSSARGWAPASAASSILCPSSTSPLASWGVCPPWPLEPLWPLEPFWALAPFWPLVPFGRWCRSRCGCSRWSRGNRWSRCGRRRAQRG